MRSLMVFALFLVTVFCAGAFAQAPGQDTKTTVAFEVEIASQPDCPLKLSLGAPRTGAPLTVKLQNTGDKPVHGYVFVIDDRSAKQIYTSVRPVHMIGTDRPEFENPNLLKPATLKISVDYVEFSDGTSWGGDEFGRSKYIKAYLTGRDLAVSRLKEMTGGTIPEEFQKMLDAFGSYSISEPARINRPDNEKRQTQAGYRAVVEMLRRSTKRAEEAQDLARKLEMMENGGS